MSTSHRSRRRGPRILAAALLVVGVVLVAAGTAGAHASLEEADPAPRASVSTAPTAITLTFTESVDMRDDGIRLLDDSMEQVDIGAVHHPDGKARVVAASVPDLPRGLYTVAWRAVSADSHPVQGAYTFGVQVSATGSAASDLTERAQAGEAGDRTVGVLYGIARFGVFVGMALLIGILGFVLFAWPAGRVARRVRLVLLGALTLTIVSTVVGYLLQGPFSSGGGLGDAFSTDLISATWDTRFGKVWMLRLLILVILGFVIHAVTLTGRERISRVAAVGTFALVVALAATPGLAGHASAGRWSTLALVMDTAHVVARGLWLGGLVALGLARHDDVAYADVAERFSWIALGSVAVLVVTGSFQAVREIDPISALWDSTYGRILIAKLVAFGLLLLVAALSRRIVHGRTLGLGRGGPVPTGEPEAMPSGAGGGVGTLERTDVAVKPAVHSGHLSRTVKVELVFGAIVLAFTSMLVNTAPPQGALTPAPVGAVLGSGAVRFDTFFGPAEAGRPNQMHVTAIDRDGVPVSVVDMRATLANPDEDIPPIEVPLEKFKTAKGHYIADGVRLPEGHWTLTITAFVTDVDSVTASTVVTVG